MNREEFTVFIKNLEEKYPVNEWKIDGVHVWPLIRIRLTFAYNTNSKPIGKESSSVSTIYKAKKAFLGLLDLAKLLFRNKSKISTKIFCLAPHFRYYDGKQYVNRYFNQLIEDSRNQGDEFLFAEYGNTSIEYRENMDFPNKTVFFENLKYLALFIREFTWKRYSNGADWPMFELFLKEVNSYSNNKKLSKNLILKQFGYINILKSLYKQILIKYSVNEAYILCYYVSEMYAMNLATAELGITSSDIQHGGQGIHHLAYANFNSIPDTGYKLLPQKFWCWDIASSMVIENWINNQNYHSVEINGNPWLDFCLNKYATQIDSTKKIIIYTLQPMGDTLLDDYVLESIRLSTNDYIWWLRLHPRQLHRKEELIQILNYHGVSDKVEIESALNTPLPAILSKCHIHISKYSGSILEASILKVKSIILDKIGVESFPEVANSEYGIVLLSQDSMHLVQTIQSV